MPSRSGASKKAPHHRKRPGIPALLVLLGTTIGVGSSAHAQTGLDRVFVLPQVVGSTPTTSNSGSDTTSDLRARQQALLDRTIRNPADLETTYAYVDASLALHDTEAAIGALERLVDYNPTLARANYQLGVLYYQLGSFDAAARYFRAAGASPTVEPQIQARIEALYPETVKQQSPSRWSGFLQTGIRYQSNASFIPEGGVVRLNGQDLLLLPSERRRADGSVFGLAQIAHDYDLQNQRGDVLETRFVGLGTKQFGVSEFDFGYVEASFGPRFGLPELMPGASIKPYVVGQTSLLRGEPAPYVSSGGGGVTLRLPIFANLTLDPGVEARVLGVNGRDALNASTVDSGHSIAGYLVTTAKLADDVDLEARFVGIRAEAGQPAQSFSKAGASLALSFQFDPPSDLIARKWKLSPFGGGAFLDFDRANAFVDPRIARRDKEYSAGVMLDAPLTATFGVSATVQYDRIDSNLPNYRQRGITVLGGPTARF